MAKVTQLKGQQQLATGDKVAKGKLSVEEWWRLTSENDLQDALVKLGEYGSHDLTEIGRAMAQVAGWEGLTDAELGELGVFFYLQGKVARMVEAFAERRWPSDDTWKDTGTYVTMARRIRDAGVWG